MHAYLVTLFQVVRLCAKSREAVSSPVEHLTLHYQVRPSSILSIYLARSDFKAFHGGYFLVCILHCHLILVQFDLYGRVGSSGHSLT